MRPGKVGWIMEYGQENGVNLKVQWVITSLKRHYQKDPVSRTTKKSIVENLMIANDGQSLLHHPQILPMKYWNTPGLRL